ncbi:putative regulator of septum formation [Streptomyces sp. 1114.5]|nr:putative regulator of septum formation [Streptomyces sp. 1114.5]
MVPNAEPIPVRRVGGVHVSEPQSELPAPVGAEPARTGADAGADTSGGTGVAVPAAELDPRVDFRKEHDEPAQSAGPAEPEPALPADPWAAPAGPTRANPQAVPPHAVPPSAAPPQPPHPLPAGGWASVPPSAHSGFQPGPQPGHPYAPPLAPAPAPTNGFAVGSLVTGLVLVAPLALLFGIVALVQINRRRERGFGMAVTGVVLGTIGTVLLALLLGAGDFSSAHPGRFGQPPKQPAGSVHWSALKAGDCYSSPEGGSVTGDGGDETVYWVRRVPCADPHHGEVAGTVKLPGSSGPYPGEDEVRESAGRLCRKVLDDYALDQWAVPDGMDDVYLYPTARNWAAGERYVTCAFEDSDDQHRGSVHTDRSGLTAPQLAYLEAVRGFDDVYLGQPKKDVSVAETEYRDWARRMATASRTEAALLGSPTAGWPVDVQPKISKLVEAQSQAAVAWDAAASGGDLAGDVRRAKALVAKTVPMNVEIRRALGLSTGEQAPDLRV